MTPADHVTVFVLRLLIGAIRQSSQCYWPVGAPDAKIYTGAWCQLVQAVDS